MSDVDDLINQADRRLRERYQLQKNEEFIGREQADVSCRICGKNIPAAEPRIGRALSKARGDWEWRHLTCPPESPRRRRRAS